MYPRHEQPSKVRSALNRFAYPAVSRVERIYPALSEMEVDDSGNVSNVNLRVGRDGRRTLVDPLRKLNIGCAAVLDLACGTAIPLMGGILEFYILRDMGTNTTMSMLAGIAGGAAVKLFYNTVAAPLSARFMIHESTKKIEDEQIQE